MTDSRRALPATALGFALLEHRAWDPDRPHLARLLVRPRRDRRRDVPGRLRAPAGQRREERTMEGEFSPPLVRLSPVGRPAAHVVADALACGPRRCVAGVGYAGCTGLHGHGVR